jgi:predicted nucleic acid-binding Zn ribbon protein
VLKVSPCAISPVLLPRRNRRLRCAEAPCAFPFPLASSEGAFENFSYTQNRNTRRKQQERSPRNMNNIFYIIGVIVVVVVVLKLIGLY